MASLNFDIASMLSLLKKLVETESPSHEKAAVDQVAALVAETCRGLGAQVHIHPQTQAGDQVVAHFAGGAGKPIILLCHMDTVFPLGTLATMPFYSRDDKTYGPGVLDMKGGIVIALEALRALREAGISPARPVIGLFTSDEESGSQASRALIEQTCAGAEVVFVLESGLLDGALKTWRKGVGDFTVRVTGRAAHSGGDHEKGRNAIEEMAHQILAIQKMTDYERGTTLNVGVIRGGTVPNVVPETCEVEVDLRVMQPGEAERIDAAMRALKPVMEGTRLEVSGALNRPPMPYNEISRAAFEKASRITQSELGFELKAGGSGGGSDGNFVAPLGVPVLDGMGAVGAEYHSDREYIFTESLTERARLLAALLQNW
jgi:glutamate carboxypeptidase